jgi:murein DD-endopeptidase MepM/ murein hydrolase activator NlpD
MKIDSWRTSDPPTKEDGGSMSVVMAILLATIPVARGDALRLAYPHEAGLESVSVEWRNRTIPMARHADEWVALLGVDLQLDPGAYPARATFRFDGGTTRTVEESVQVYSKEFPTTRLTVEPGYVELSPENLARANRESARLAEVFDQVTPETYWTEPFGVPIPGAVGSNFGHARVFNDQPRNPHSGADIAAGTGTPIQSTNRGRVVETGDYFFNGNTVIVDHGQGVFAVYLHLSRIDVEVGQMIEKGGVVGLVGATGRVTGPHLHWGFRVQDARVDPFSLTRISRRLPIDGLLD